MTLEYLSHPCREISQRESGTRHEIQQDRRHRRACNYRQHHRAICLSSIKEKKHEKISRLILDLLDELFVLLLSLQFIDAAVDGSFPC